MMPHFRLPPPPCGNSTNLHMLERLRPMMGDLQHFCLRWNNYQNNITSAFENLRDDEDFVDVTLACDGKSLKAHRVVLSACSAYFRELLKSTPCKHPVIVLQDVSFEDLQCLVQFIYHGEVNVHQRNLTSFLKTAELLKVSGLTQHSTDAFPDNLSTTSRSPDTVEKSNVFPGLNSNSSNMIEEASSPRSLHRHRRLVRSPTPIRSTYPHDDSALSVKRAKSAEISSPGQNCSSSSSTADVGEMHKTISQHSSPLLGNYDVNHNDEEGSNNNDQLINDDDEPPMDFSRHSYKKFCQTVAQDLSSPKTSPKDLSIKSEAIDLAPCSNDPYNEDSNNSDDRLSEPSSRNHSISEHEEAYHRNYLDSKLFAAAGATFNFNMAAALAAESFSGFNNPAHGNGSNSVLDGLAASSQGLKKVFPCLACGKVLCSKASLKRHVADKHASHQEEYRCAICERVYCSRNSLMTHIYTYHKTRPTLLIPPHHSGSPANSHAAADIKS